MMTPHAFKIAAWAILAGIIVVTVSPIGWRPGDVLPVDMDRALAFMLVTALFVVAYPRHFIVCAVLLVVGAAAMELLQLLSPTRHAHFDDAAVKAAGAALGALFGRAVNLSRSARKA